MSPVLAALLALLAAAPAAAASPLLDAEGCAADYAPGTSYFPEQSHPDYAEGFSVAYLDHYKILTVTPPDTTEPSATYVLVQCGTPDPELGPELAGAPRIQIPIRSLFVGSTSANPALVAISAVPAITGVAQRDFIATAEVIDHIHTKPVVEYAPSGIANIEAALANRPDLLLAAGGDETELQRIAGAGIPVAGFADWQETSPLGRAEWVKFVGLFFNAEAKANAAFDEVARSYQTATARVAGIPQSERPLVLSGQAFNGVFFAAGGRSFMAQLIGDAGGRYVFAENTSTGSFQIRDLELLVSRARSARVWIQASMNYLTLADIQAEDPRLAALPAAKAGQVWIPDALKGPNGGVQFYELGSMRPDLVLMDLISILHPDRTPGYRRVFNRSIAID
ncbi:iron complex transport system substrate-binding protein [Devosia crocina]|uniref:Iron complex transport system substrate-binding protein n=1 Tax=Devosia crocina TaxID=429728 RepID=A0A1I7N2J4_9HYPH|nr:ABC transporter substrate-binding protein [Devosia crocina]SFV28872.1 iron complex transport system substrate-binding protein [Devosia crocina]